MSRIQTGSRNITANYNPDQPRDEDGKWSGGGPESASEEVDLKGELNRIGGGDANKAAGELKKFLSGKSYVEKMEARRFYQEKARSAPADKGRWMGRFYTKLAKIATDSLNRP